jgi:antitoxin YefM
MSRLETPAFSPFKIANIFVILPCMTTTYRLNVNELSFEIINSIKAAFKDKEVEITVTETIDETAYLLASPANRRSLELSMQQAERGEVQTFTIEELKEKYGIE